MDCHHKRSPITPKVLPMLNQFVDEVISQGAEALLPQELEEKWLDRMYVAAKNFLQMAMKPEGVISEEDILNDINSMIMLSSIVEIAQHQSGYAPSDQPYEIPEDMLFEYISCYALAIVLESISRESGMGVDSPTLETIFERDRLFSIEQSNPEITVLLNKLISEESES